MFIIASKSNTRIQVFKNYSNNKCTLNIGFGSQIIKGKNKKSLADLVKEMKKINPESLIIFQSNHSGNISGSFSDVVSYYPTYTPTTDYGGFWVFLEPPDLRRWQKTLQSRWLYVA